MCICVVSTTSYEPEQFDLVVIPPNDRHGDSDCERIDEDDILDTQADVSRIREISGSLEVHINGSAPTESSDEEEEENLTLPVPSAVDAIKMKVADVIQSQCPKADKIKELVSCMNTLKPIIKGSWDSKEVLSEKLTVNPALSPKQNDAFNKTVDNFNGISPRESFEQLFDSEVKNLIITESNRYAHEQKNEPSFLLSEEKLNRFVGVLLYSGYHTLPRQRQYWESSPDLVTDIVSRSLSRNDFEEIKKYIHLADNNNLAPRKFAKVMPLYDMANSKLKKYGWIHNNLSIDEQMIPYTGMHSAKQTLREKTVRFGYKSFVLTSSDGYCYHTIPYEGAKTGSYHPGVVGKDLSKRMVCDLMLEVEELHSTTVTMDNWYSSPELIACLGYAGTCARATCRADRLLNAPVLNNKDLPSK